jgi:hypothetical protein
MSSGVTHILFSIVLGVILILALGVYSGLSGRDRTVYLFSLYVFSLLPSRFTASTLIWFYIFLSTWYSTFLFHWTLCPFVDLNRSSDYLHIREPLECIGEFWIESAGVFRCWNWRLSPINEFRRSILIWVLLCIGGFCFLLIVLIIFRAVRAFVTLLRWADCFLFCFAHVNFQPHVAVLPNLPELQVLVTRHKMTYGYNLLS